MPVGYFDFYSRDPFTSRNTDEEREFYEQLARSYLTDNPQWQEVTIPTATGNVQFTRSDLFGEPIGEPPKWKVSLLKELEMDMKDVVWFVFKGQQRIVGSRYFEAVTYEGRTSHRYQREDAVYNGSYAVFYKSVMIGKTVRKPHLQLTITKLRKANYTPRNIYAQALLYRVTKEQFPYCKIGHD